VRLPHALPVALSLPAATALMTVLLTGLTAAPAANASSASYVTATDANWAGYAAIGPRFRYVQADFRAPVLDCARTRGTASDPAQVSDWIGFDGILTGTVEQDGITGLCTDGAASYQVWWETYPQAPDDQDVTVNPGDIIEASVSYSRGEYLFRVTDVTDGQHFSAFSGCGASACANKTAEVVSEDPLVLDDPSVFYPMADYGTTTFWDIKVIDQAGAAGTFDTPAWQNSQITMIDDAGHVKASTAGLTDGGTAFRTYWKRPA
jgi:hypothetical protein